MKFWNWGPTTIAHYCMSVTFYFSKSLHPTTYGRVWWITVSPAPEELAEDFLGSGEVKPGHLLCEQQQPSSSTVVHIKSHHQQRH